MLLALLLSAAPATGLTLSEQMGKVGTPVTAYLDAIEQELVAGGVPVRQLKLSCSGKRDCLLAGAKEAGLPALVAVTVAYGKKQTTIDLEGLRTTDGTTLAQLTFTVGSRLTEPDRAAVQKFGTKLAALLSQSDVPRVEKPVEPPPRVITADPPPPSLELSAPKVKAARSTAPGWLLGGGAVVAGATSGIFLGLATSSRATLETTPDPSPLTRSQATGIAADANRDYSVALATGLAAGALATAAIIWLVSE